MATIFPISSPTSIKDFPAALLNPSSSYTTGINDSKYPYIVSEGFHAGSINFEKFGFTLDAYDGCGFNKYGFYGIVPTPLGALPKVLIASRSFTNAGWGTVQMGEFRVGDNVKEDGGTLVGKSWLRYSSKTGLTVAGPLLRSSSSDVNIIQSPGFSNLTEFVLTNMTAGEDLGYLETEGVTLTPLEDREAPTSVCSIGVVGDKVTSGSTIIRGTFLYKASSDFNGEVKVQAEVEGGITDSSVIQEIQLTGEWHRFDYALRLKELAKLPFTLKIIVTGNSTGTLSLDNWSAYRVFEYGISSNGIPDVLEDTEGVLLDQSGIRAFRVDDPTTPELLTKVFSINSSSGDSFLRGNVLVQGYMHSGTLFDEEQLETTESPEVVDWDGCGLNTYGVYGTSFDPNTVSRTGYFLLAAKSLDMSATPNSYWGSGIAKGELRVGNGVALNSAKDGLITGGEYLWFHPDNGLVLSGKLYAGDFIFGKEIATANLGGVETKQSGLYLDDNNYWLDCDSTNTNGVMKAGGIFVTEDTVEIGVVDTHSITIGNTTDPSRVTLNNLELSGHISLIGSSDPTTGTPGSYIGIINDTGSSFLSKDGLALGTGNLITNPTSFNWNAFLLGPEHPWTPDDKSWFYAGDGFSYSDSSTYDLGSNYIFFDGTNLKIKGDLHLGIDNYLHIGAQGNTECGYIDHSAIAFYGDTDVVNILLGTSTHSWLGSTYGTSFIIGTNVENHTSSIDCPDLLMFSQEQGLTIRVDGDDVVSLLKEKTTTYIQDDEPTDPPKNLVTGDLWIDTNDNYAIYSFNGSSWVQSTNGAAVDGKQLFVVYNTNDLSNIPNPPASVSGTDTTDRNNGWSKSASGAHWMSQKLDENPEVSSAWGAVIQLSGNLGQGQVKGVCFKKSATTITDIPTGGSYTNPTALDWFDGIPSGNDPLYMCTRIFTSDGQPPQQSEWTAPQKVSELGDGISVEFSIDANHWHSDALETDIYMRTNTIINGAITYGNAIKIKGEKGDPGDPGDPGQSIDIIYKRSETDPGTPTANGGIPSGWSTFSTVTGTGYLWASTGTKSSSASDYTWQASVKIEGSKGDPAFSVAEITCYRKQPNSVTSLAAPTGGSYTFSPRSFTSPTNWLATLPSYDPATEVVFMSRTTVSTVTPEVAVSISGWSAPAIFLKTGPPGVTEIDWVDITDINSKVPFLIGGVSTDAGLYLSGEYLGFYPEDVTNKPTTYISSTGDFALNFWTGVAGDTKPLGSGTLTYTASTGKLELDGPLLLDAETKPSGVPTSYIGLNNGAKHTYFSSDGVAITSDNHNSWNAFLLGPDHPWTPTDNSWFYVGTGFSYNSSPPHDLGNRYIFFDGDTLDIKGKIIATSGEFRGNITVDGKLMCAGNTQGHDFVFGKDIAVLDSVNQSGLYLDNDNYWLNGSSSESGHGTLKAGGIYVTNDQTQIGKLNTGAIGVTHLKNLSVTGWIKIFDDPNDSSNHGYIYCQGVASNHWVGISSKGIAAAYDSGKYSFLLSNGLGDAYGEVGEVRIGKDVSNIDNSTSYLRYRSTEGLEVKGNIKATSGYFSSYFYVGTTSNKVILNANGSAPYIRSSGNTTTSEYGNTGWKINYNGIAEFNRITPYDGGDFVNINAPFATLYPYATDHTSSTSCYVQASRKHWDSGYPDGYPNVSILASYSGDSASIQCIGRKYGDSSYNGSLVLSASSSIQIYPTSSTSKLSFFGAAGVTSGARAVTDLASVINLLKAYGLAT